MFNALKWTLKQGAGGVIIMCGWMAFGFAIMGTVCYLLGGKYAFYAPRLFETWSGLPPLFVGLIFGAWAGAFIASVCTAGWSREINSLRNPAIPLQGATGIAMGHAIAIFLFLRSADQAMAMGVAIGLAAVFGCVLDIWIMKRGIKPL